MVGRRLRRRRRLMGLTQGELGTLCGVSFQQVQKYECGATRLSVAMLWSLACALEVDIGYFFVDLPRNLPVDEARRRRPAEPRAIAAETVMPARANAA
jgi:transcriptional regulator with XRE-family HTH domain